MKKYKFTGETKEFLEKKLNRIMALKDFGDVKAGDLGGWIENEDNLSHEGRCWVYDDAVVREEACISQNAIVRHKAEVWGKALMHEDAGAFQEVKIYGDTEIYGRAEIYGTSQIFQKAKVGVNAKIVGAVNIYGNAWICGNSIVQENATIEGTSEVFGNCVISERAYIHENSRICGNAKISGSAEIRGNVIISEDIKICGNALIELFRDYILIGPIGSKNRTVAAFRTTDGIKIKAGCFYGDIDEFEKRVKLTHKDNIYGEEYLIFVELLKKRFNEKIPLNGGNHYVGGKEKN